MIHRNLHPSGTPGAYYSTHPCTVLLTQLLAVSKLKYLCVQHCTLVGVLVLGPQGSIMMCQ